MENEENRFNGWSIQQDRLSARLGRAVITVEAVAETTPEEAVAGMIRTAGELGIRGDPGAPSTIRLKREGFGEPGQSIMVRVTLDGVPELAVRMKDIRRDPAGMTLREIALKGRPQDFLRWAVLGTGEPGKIVWTGG